MFNTSITRQYLAKIDFLASREDLFLVPKTDFDAARLIAALAQDEETGAWATWRDYGKGNGDWYVWDGKIHRTVGEEVDNLLVQKFVEDVANVTAAYDPKDNYAKDYVAAVKRWKTAAGFAGLQRMVRTALRVPADYFDQPSSLVVMQNGWLIDTENPEWQPIEPSPTRPVTRTLGTSADIDDDFSQCFLWHGWLNRCVPNKEEQIFLQKLAGAALLGRGDAKHIVMFYGGKDSGKSLYMNVLGSVFGDYAGHLSSTALSDKGTNTNFAQSEAKGLRFICMSEPNISGRTDDGYLKAISGSRDPIRTRDLYQSSETWYSQGVLHVGTNVLLNFNTRDAAIVDRINIIAMTPIPEEEQDETLEARLIERESSYILAWILAGAEMYLSERIEVPESIRARGQQNVVQRSSALQWLEDVIAEGVAYVSIDLESTKDEWVERSKAYADYKTWCFENGTKPLRANQFSQEINTKCGLAQTAPEPQNRSGKRVLHGVRLHGAAFPLRTVA